MQDDYSFIASAIYGEADISYSTEHDGAYKSVVPIISGTYYVKAVVEESDNYLGCELIEEYSISKTKIQTPTIENKFYNKTKQIADITSTELFTVEKNLGGINAGEYNVELKIKDFLHYEWEEDNSKAIFIVKFKILQAENQLELIVSNWSYGDSAIKPVAIAKFGVARITYSSDNLEYSDTVPTNAGTYYVKATVEETINFKALSITEELVIYKKTLSDPVLENKVYNGLFQTIIFLDLPYSSMANCGINAGSYDINIVLNDFNNYEWQNSLTELLTLSYQILQAQNSIIKFEINEDYSANVVSTFGTPVVLYSTSENGEYNSVVPVNAGTYYIKAEVTGTNNYSGASEIKQFIIHKKQVKTPYINPKFYNGEKLYADIESTQIYSVLENAGGIDAGNYVVKLVLNDYVNYEWEEDTSTDLLNVTFTILQAENTLSLTVNDWIYSETAIYPTATALFGELSITYSISEDGEYVSNIPTQAGTYYVKATVEETQNYSGVTEIKQLTIKRKGILEPSIANLTYNGNFQKAQISDTAYYVVSKNYSVINVGTYFVQLDISDFNYIFKSNNSNTIILSYEIVQAENSVELNISDWTYYMYNGNIINGLITKS